MASAAYAPALPTERPPRCCSRCRTPWNCGNPGCACHAAAQMPLLPRPDGGWGTWHDVLQSLPQPLDRALLRLDPREFQTRWFVRHLVVVPQAPKKESD